MPDILSPLVLEKFGLIYHEDRMGLVRTAKPTGRLDPIRMLEGRADCWLNPQAAKHDAFIKKTLIISDVNLGANEAFQASDKTRLGVDHYKKLFMDGFEMFVWTETGPIKINNLYQVGEFIYRAWPASPEDIAKAMGRLGKAVNSIKIIDMFESCKIQDFIYEGSIKPYYYLDQQIILQLREIHGDKLNPAVLASLGPKFLESYGLKCSNPKSVEKDISPRIPKLGILKALDITNFTSYNLHFKEKPSLVLEELISSGEQLIHFKANAIKHLSLRIDVQKIGMQVDFILSQTELKTLTLDWEKISQLSEKDLESFWEEFKKPFERDNLNLTHLTHLNMITMPRQIPWRIFSKWMPRLQELKITFSGNRALQLNNVIFQHLKSIKLENIEVKINDLLSFIAKHPRLENIKLAFVKTNFDEPYLACPTLPNIKSLEMHESHLHKQISINFLSYFPNLEHFNYSSANPWPVHFEFVNLKWEQLKILKLRNISVNLENLLSFIATAPNLKQIAINNCRGLTDLAANHQILTQTLESLSLTYMPDLNAQNFIGWLTPTLQELDISYSFFSMGDYAPNLKSLRKLNLLNSKVSFQDIIKLCEFAPDVWELDLSGCEDLGENFPEQLVNLPGIKDLVIDKCAISQLNYLVSAAHNLESLCIKGIIKNSGSLAVSELLNLKKLILMDVMDENFVHTILSRVPNLVSLRLDSMCFELLNLDAINLIPKKLNYLYVYICDGFLMCDEEVVPGDYEKLQKLLDNCSTLETLVFSYDGTENLSTMLKEIRLPNIKQLTLPYSITGEDKYSLSKDYPHIQIFAHVEESAVEDTMKISPPNYNFIDANTIKDPNKILNANQYFYSKLNKLPVVNYYRCSVESKNNWNIINHDFSYQSKHGESLTEFYFNNLATTTNLFLGKIELKPYQLTPLPSLTPEDKLVSLAIKENVLIYHNEETRQYAAFLKNPKPALLHFLIQANLRTDLREVFGAPLSEQDIHFFAQLSFDHKSLVPQCQQLIKQYVGSMPLEGRIGLLSAFCRSFVPGELKLDEQSPPAILNAMLRQRHGSCRHARRLFIALAKYFGIKARSVYSEIHQWVEVYYQNKWVSMCLGGYNSQLNIREIPDEAAQSRETPLRGEASQEKSVKQNIFLPMLDAVPTEPFMPFLEKLIDDAAPKNILLTCNDVHHLEEAMGIIAQTVTKKGRQFHYISRLADVSAKEFHVQVAHFGEELPKNCLLDRLENGSEGDVLMVNIADYNKEDVAACNELMAARTLLGYKLSQGVRIILIALNATRMSLDLYSRVNKFSCPKIDLNLLDKSPMLKDMATLTRVSLYQDNDWRDLLFGRIRLEGQTFLFQPGALLIALKEGKRGIVIYNPPLHLEECRISLSLLRNTREIRYNGLDITLPDYFEIITLPYSYQLEKIDLPISVSKVSTGEEIPHWQFVLNQSTYLNFFNNFIFQNNLPYETPGWINDEPSSVLVTSQFTHMQWARLMHHLKAVRTHCQFIFPHDISMPNWMQSKVVPSPVEFADRKLAPRWVVTNDVEFAERVICAQLLAPNITSITIDPEITYNDLISTVIMDERRAFLPQTGIVAKKLALHDQTVILKGEISEELADRLQTLWHQTPHLYDNGKRLAVEGKLIIITNNATTYSLTPKERVEFSLNHYCDLLQREFSPHIIEGLLNKLQQFLFKANQKNIKINFNYHQLQQMALMYHEYDNPILPFILMHPEAETLRACFDVDMLESPVTSESFIKKRCDSLDKLLMHNRLVFIVGPTGSGKTTFVLKDYARPTIKLFVGKSNSLAWAQSRVSQPDEKLILVLDEVNIDDEGSLSQYTNSAGILIENQYYPITDAHRIILIGNPHSYANRSYHRLFSQAAIIEFEGLPDFYLKEKIIVPLLTAPALVERFTGREQLQQITEFFIQVYQWMLALSEGPTITPRNLQHMCLHLAITDQAPTTIAKEEFFPLLSPAQRQALETFLIPFEKLFEPASLPMEDITLMALPQTNLKQNRLPQSFAGFKQDKFVLTPSRQQALLTLHHEFEIRQLKLSHPTINEFAAINGLLFEGEPGIGKSEMVLEYLQAHGFKAVINLPSKPESLSHCFYHLTNLTNFADLTPTLLKAFHCGMVVVIDEFSSLPLEKTLNALLMGVDLQGSPAHYPGFFIIGTQNPITFVNRRALSPALANRLIQYPLPSYTRQELIEIACKKGLPQLQAESLVTEFRDALKIAHALHLTNDAPTFRQFLAKVNEISIERRKAYEARARIPNTNFFLYRQLPDDPEPPTKKARLS